MVGPGPIDEQLLAGFVFLAQNDILFPTPALIEFTEPAVPIAVRVGFPVLFPEQLQGNEALCLALLMNGRKVRRGSIRLAGMAGSEPNSAASSFGSSQPSGSGHLIPARSARAR